MPVRKIPKNYRSVTGLVASELNAKQTAFESTLERDFMLLAEFDPDVLSYEEQPVRIGYLSVDGQTRHYTPDILVTYRQTSTSTMPKPPLLVEIKYRRDLFECWRELKPKFRAARRHAKEQGWIFKIITEEERFATIRPLLGDVRRTRESVAIQAQTAKVHTGTVYRWLELYERTGRVSALLPTKPNGGRGRSRLSPEVEAVIKEALENYYLKQQKPSAQKTCLEAIRLCRQADLKPPHPKTICTDCR